MESERLDDLIVTAMLTAMREAETIEAAAVAKVLLVTHAALRNGWIDELAERLVAWRSTARKARRPSPTSSSWRWSPATGARS